MIPVGNLEALAAAARELAPEVRRIGVALDARMHEAYWAVYECADDLLQEVAAPALVGFSGLARSLESFGVDTVAGNAFGTLRMPGAAALGGAAFVLMIAAALASMWPAARAARVDVLQALRTE